MSDVVTVVNRTGKNIEWMWDGRVYAIGPYAKKAVLDIAARHGRIKTRFGFAMDSGAWKYQLGILEDGHEVTPLDKAEEPQKGDELIQRSVEDQKNFKKKIFSNPELALSRSVGDIGT